MPEKQNVPHAQLALIVHAIESQRIAPARESIDAVSLAIFWHDAAGSVNRQLIAIN